MTNNKKSCVAVSIGLVLLSLSICCKGPAKATGEREKETKKIVLKVAHNGPEVHPFQKGYEKFKEILEKSRLLVLKENYNTEMHKCNKYKLLEDFQ